MYSPSKPMPNNSTPIRKNVMANRVNTPWTSAPRMKRRTTSRMNKTADASDSSIPIAENHCSGTTEKPVTRSKFKRTSLYSEYFDSPARRSS